MTKDINNTQTTTLTASSNLQLENRNKLWSMFKESPLPEPELERSLGLYIRGSLLARFLAINEIYQKIVEIPGAIFDIGCWRGQTSILCENYRAIYEPFNKERRIVAFDTFEGYAGVGESDKPTENYDEGTYSTGIEYADYLKNLLATHEGNNILAHVENKHRVVVGDATKTVPNYLEEYPETLLALVFLDLGLHQPTKSVLDALLKKNRIQAGTLFAFYHLTRDSVLPGDSIAFQESFKDKKYKIRRSSFYPSLSIVEILN